MYLGSAFWVSNKILMGEALCGNISFLLPLQQHFGSVSFMALILDYFECDEILVNSLGSVFFSWLLMQSTAKK